MTSRPHPPSSQRIAEARASGHLPRAPLVGFGAGLLALLGTGALLGPRFVRQWGELLAAPLAAGARGYASSCASLRALGLTLVLALLLVFLAIVLGTLLAQGPSFARLSSQRGSFPAQRPGRIASVLWCLGLLVLVLGQLADWTRFERASLPELATSGAVALTLLTLACLVIDVAFARARFFASLWLSRRAFMDEQREAHGAPELRAARERTRRELRGAP